jgi:hypothetical protein
MRLPRKKRRYRGIADGSDGGGGYCGKKECTNLEGGSKDAKLDERHLIR